jgi:hypothetical protein
MGMNFIKRSFYLFLANLIFYFHLIAMVAIHLGWLFPVYRLTYLIFITLVLVQHLILGYCVFTPWEYYFRRKINHGFNKSDKNFTAINLKRFFGINATNRCVDATSATFLIGMIILQTILIFYK